MPPPGGNSSPRFISLNPDIETFAPNGIDFTYINLNQSVKRRRHMQRQLWASGIPASRWPATRVLLIVVLAGVVRIRVLFFVVLVVCLKSLPGTCPIGRCLSHPASDSLPPFSCETNSTLSLFVDRCTDTQMHTNRFQACDTQKHISGNLLVGNLQVDTGVSLFVLAKKPVYH